MLKKYLIFALAISAVLSIAILSITKACVIKINALTKDEVGKIAIDYINNNFVEVGEAKLISVEEMSGVYKVITSYRGMEIPVYMTEDGKYLLDVRRVYNVSENITKKKIDIKVDCNNTIDGYDAVFIYSPSCPHCRKMIPMVESSNIKWYWIYPGNPSCKDINYTRFGFKGYVPHFYCLKNGYNHTGEMTEDMFQEWVSGCGSVNFTSDD